MSNRITTVLVLVRLPTTGDRWLREVSQTTVFITSHLLGYGRQLHGCLYYQMMPAHDVHTTLVTESSALNMCKSGSALSGTT